MPLYLSSLHDPLPIFTFIVISNGTYGWIKAGQKSAYDKRYFGGDFEITDHAAVAAAFGVKSWRVTEPGDLGKTLKEALAHGRSEEHTSEIQSPDHLLF